MGVSIEWNPDFEAEVIEAARPQVLEVAEAVAGEIEAGRVFPEDLTGPVEVAPSEKGYTVGFTGRWGHLEEWGSKNNPPYATVRRAAEASGLDFAEAPKGA